MFLSKLFSVIGYGGRVILFDEAELLGSLGRQTRFKAYENLYDFMIPERLEATYSFFAFSSIFTQDVIMGKDEYAYLAKIEDHLKKDKIKTVLQRIGDAAELKVHPIG